MREKYGVDNISQLEEIKDKKRQTCMDHYGVDNPSRAPEVQKKRDETFMERFGGNPWKSEEVRKKIAATCMERYGAPNPFMLDEFQNKARASVFKKYGVKNIFMLPEVRKRAAERCSRISKVNYEWKKSLEDATGLEFETEVRFGDDAYADLGVPDKKLLIEINPAVTHNSMIHYAT
jgi:vsr/mutH/archaeal HJR family nuclease